MSDKKERAFYSRSLIPTPIRDFTGKVIAAIGVDFMSTSEDEEGKHLIIKEVLNMAYEIFQELGHIERNAIPRGYVS